MPLVQTVLNIAANSLKRHNFDVMLEKVYARLRDYNHARQGKAAASWCAEHAMAWADFANVLDPALWEETKKACEHLKHNADEKLKKIRLDLGGGGHYPLLYFMTRHVNPRVVVETGVAAGWSSQAILTALRENRNEGHLYSSDFPYFRLENPERYIGYVVDEDLKPAWTLLIDGDRHNLPVIMEQEECVELFHYDSDKSYSGRTFAMECLEPKLSAHTAILFDDIQDNFHFRDMVEGRGWPFRVFSFEGKFSGLTGPFMQNLPV